MPGIRWLRCNCFEMFFSPQKRQKKIKRQRQISKVKRAEVYFSVEIKKTMFRIESRRDGQRLAPDVIRGTSKKMIQAPVGRQSQPFKTSVCRPAGAGDSSWTTYPALTHGANVCASRWDSIRKFFFLTSISIKTKNEVPTFYLLPFDICLLISL
jgi:hypothetical protein